MLVPILIALAVVVVAFVVFVALRPSEFRVSRSGTISASPGEVFEQVNDLHCWEAWSPWAKLDPAARNTYEGPREGVGAAFAWSGNKRVGEGRMTIIESRPTELVRFRLDFVKPFKGTNTADFTVQPEGGGTRVTWTMLGKNNFFFKAMQLFIDCDKMVGRDFEKGLEQLKSVTEAAVRKAA